MKTTLITLDGLARELKVELAIADFQAAVKVELNKLAKTVKLNGFRDGKVPIQVIQQRFGASIRAEIGQKMVSEQLPKAFKQEEVSPAATPNLTVLDTDNPKALTFTVLFDVFPEIELAPINELSFSQTQCDIKQTDIDQTILDLRRQQANYTKTEARAVDTDRVNIDFTGCINEVVFEGGKAKSFDIILGQGKMVKGFEQGLLGKKSGDTFELDIIFPTDYQIAELSGKAAVFSIIVNDVFSMILPELDNELAKKYHKKNVNDLVASVKENMQFELEKNLSAANKEQAFNALAQANPLEIPQSAILEEAKHLLDDTKKKMQQQNMDAKMIDTMEVNAFNDEAKKRLHFGLLMAKISDEEKIEASPEQVDAKIKNIAIENGQSEKSTLEWYHKDDKQNLMGIKSLLTEDLILAHLIENAKVNNNNKTFQNLVHNN